MYEVKIKFDKNDAKIYLNNLRDKIISNIDTVVMDNDILDSSNMIKCGCPYEHHLHLIKMCDKKSLISRIFNPCPEFKCIYCGSVYKLSSDSLYVRIKHIQDIDNLINLIYTNLYFYLSNRKKEKKSVNYINDVYDMIEYIKKY